MSRCQPRSPALSSPIAQKLCARTPNSATKSACLAHAEPAAYKLWPNEASSNPNDQTFWSLRGDFLRSGVHVYSKSGDHRIEDPFDKSRKRIVDGKIRVPTWLQIQFTVVIPTESNWVCELAMKNHGGLLIGRELLAAVQSEAQGIEPVLPPSFIQCLCDFTGDISPFHRTTPRSPHKGKFRIRLRPMCDPRGVTDNPPISISYFVPYTEKAYTQAMDGTLPYQFVMTRVSKGTANMRKNWWAF